MPTDASRAADKIAAQAITDSPNAFPNDDDMSDGIKRKGAGKDTISIPDRDD